MKNLKEPKLTPKGATKRREITASRQKEIKKDYRRNK